MCVCVHVCVCVYVCVCACVCVCMCVCACACVCVCVCVHVCVCGYQATRDLIYCPDKTLLLSSVVHEYLTRTRMREGVMSSGLVSIYICVCVYACM